MFKGSNVALITPFKNNLLDEEAYIKLIHFHIENGTSGLVPAGTTGESPTLSHDEHQKVIDLCIKESNGKIPVIARCKESGENKTILFNLCGHGHFDMQAYIDYFDNKLFDDKYSESEIAMALSGLPSVG